MARSVCLAFFALGLVAASAHAQSGPADLRLATLEELMAIEVTSASRREQRAEDVPAAVYVIDRHQIRRSGLTSIPEILRLAPGVQVARLNSNKWAVSVRGFGSLYSNKVLVMIDGRSIYNPAFSSVIWDTEDLLVEDIDRIEVIRGPGGAMWGANAVNGVINIITRSASETRGGLARVTGGTLDTSSAAVRYGGLLGAASYRAFVQATLTGETRLPSGVSANDGWHSATGGFRADWSGVDDALMVQAAATSGRQRPLWLALDADPGAPWARSTTGVGHLLARWTHTDAAGGALQVQGYVDRARRDERICYYARRTWDLDAQYHTHLWARHELVAGGGYRYITEELIGRGGYAFTPGLVSPRIVNGFVQDAISLAGDRVEVTLGTKFEDNSFAGSGLQPNARVRWTLAPEQRVWAAVSRAFRSPSLIDRGLSVMYPPVPAAALAAGLGGVALSAGTTLPPGLPVILGATGNPDFHSEHFLEVEAGYRVGIGRVASVDAVGFAGRYDDLQTLEPLAPEMTIIGGVPHLRLLTRYDNAAGADTRGAELVGRLQLRDGWQVDGTLTVFHLDSRPGDSLDPRIGDYAGHVPGHQWRAHLAFPFLSRGQGDVHLFRAGGIRQIEVPAYARLDARLEWPITPGLSAVASGQNLLDRAHAEFLGHDANVQSTLVPRSGALRLEWRF